MPYIIPERRKVYSHIDKAIFKEPRPIMPVDALTYLLARVVTRFLQDHRRSDGYLSWDTCSDAEKALDSVKSEVRRRFTNPHEDQKIIENGDVFKEA